MNNTLNTTAPVAVEEKSGRRRGASLFAGTAVALSLLAGATAALFTDSEWLGAGSGGIGVTTERFNIQIADVTLDVVDNGFNVAQAIEGHLLTYYTFKDTSEDGQNPDGYWETSVDSPITFDGIADLYPGWSTTVYVLLRNDSSVPTTLSFALVDAEDPEDSENPIFQNLSWQVDIYYATLTGSGSSTSVYQLASGEPNTASEQSGNSGKLILKESVSALEPGGVVAASITITFSDQVSFETMSNIATNNLSLDLLLKFTGEQVVAA